LLCQLEMDWLQRLEIESKKQLINFKKIFVIQLI
jgi:hypothetical protein